MFGPKRHVPIDSPEGKAITWVLLLAGLFICLLGYPGTRQYHQIKDELVEVPAIITEASGGRKHRNVRVTYTYEGTVYEDVKVNVTYSDMVEGMELTVPIHPDEPGKLVYNTMGGIFGFGLFYAGMALLFWIAARWPRKPKEKPAPKPNQLKKRRKKKKKKHRRR